jgi:hypothetical protein
VRFQDQLQAGLKADESVGACADRMRSFRTKRMRFGAGISIVLTFSLRSFAAAPR